ncbi:MAG: PaaI family thioesterase [Candidatus Eiseniibacteriota bacterium]
MKAASGQVWEVRNPAFEAVVRENFARQVHMATLGATITRLEPGAVDLTAPYDPRFVQQNGFWHAGAVASLADSANGYAAYSLAPPGTDVLAVEFKINLLAPAQGDSFRAEGRVLRPGRTLTVCRGDVFGVTGDATTLIATMLSTIIVRPAEVGG